MDHFTIIIEILSSQRYFPHLIIMLDSQRKGKVLDFSIQTSSCIAAKVFKKHMSMSKKVSYYQPDNYKYL